MNIRVVDNQLRDRRRRYDNWHGYDLRGFIVWANQEIVRLGIREGRDA